ncbi:gamma-glutamyltransferase [Telluribacter humicola]|uniref:gamma-glutamyltransferase n=1 Tax=Telluribacter humicola TaxID=1720261 RepID=UPI001A9680F0|nr:gamma-glutamyltransferase [Telluribacter humicola]
MKKVVAVVSILFISLFSQAQDRLSGRSFATRSEVIAPHGMVASSNPLANQVGIEILKKGGSAVDAAIAINAMLALTDPAMCGPGGDLFAIVWDAKQKKLFGLNASGRSPQALSMEYFQEKGLKQVPIRGPLSVTVPGCVDGWYQLHGRFGKLPMPALLSPTITYAREGVPVTAEVADWMRITYDAQKEALDKRSTFRQVYMPNGKFPVKGELFQNPDLARTLEAISKGGRDAFYKGPIAKAIADHVLKEGGFLSAEDLARHSSEWVEPVSTNYRGYDVWELPPNGQGIAALQMLNILEGFDLKAAGFGSADYLHLLAEAKKLAFEDMATYYGDPAFSKLPTQQLISKEYAAERRKLINKDKAGVYQAGKPGPQHTVYLTTADAEGNMVSLIQSNAYVFGSFEVPQGVGFVLHNRGSGFELQDKHINGYAPGKRPFHTIIPGFVTKEGLPYLSFGVLGGDMQAQGHVQVLTNMIDFGMDVQEAGDAPRINHHGTFPAQGHTTTVGTTAVESGFSYETIRELMRRGHVVQFDYGFFGGYQAIRYDGKVYYGGSDARKDGQATGY